MISAPVAPIAPPSVGVATPRKIVPSTRKISASGGISTNTTRSAIFDSRPNLNTRFSTAAKKATPVPTLVAMTSVSSSARSAIRSFAYATAATIGDDDEHDQRRRAAAAVRLAHRARFRRQRRRPVRLDDRRAEHVQRVEAGEHDAGDERAGVHVADRAAELVGHDDQHERRRDDLRERAGRGDDAGREPPVVAVAQHDRQRDQAHRDHAGGDDAGRGREQRADEDDRVGEPAAQRPEQLADRVEQVLGHAGALEDQSHEREERHGEQRVVRHHAEHALGQRLQQRRVEQAELDAERGRSTMPTAPSEKATGKPISSVTISAAEHQRRDVRDEPGGHGVPLSLVGSCLEHRRFDAALRARSPRRAPPPRTCRGASRADRECGRAGTRCA